MGENNMALIKTIKSNSTGDTIYPRTKASAVSLADTNDSIESVLLIAEDQDEPTGEVSFITQDELNPSSSVSVDKLEGTDSWSQRFVKISQMFKNIRYLFKRIDSVEDNLNFIVKTYTFKIGTVIGNISPGDPAHVKASQFSFSTPDGYTPLGIQRVTYNDDKMIIRGVNATAIGDTIALYGKNGGATSTGSTLEAAISIVYVKTGLVH